MTTIPIIPLAEAYLCLDCRVLHDNPHQCPQCASSLAGALMKMSPILDRPEALHDRKSLREAISR
jgi:hypothetical protein